MFYPVDGSFDDMRKNLMFDVMTLHQNHKTLEYLKSIVLTQDTTVFIGEDAKFENLLGDELHVSFSTNTVVDNIAILSNEVIDGVRYVGVDGLIITQDRYWKLRKLINALGIDATAPATCLRHRCRGFYKSSKEQLHKLRKDDFFTWLSIHSYMMAPIINVMLFAANGDWTKFDQKFSNVVETRIRVKKYSDPKDPYNIFNTFYRGLIVEGGEKGKFLADRSRKHKITGYKTLVQHYPEMRPYLAMKDKAKFTVTYAKALNSAINSIPRLLHTLQTYRGYTPLNLPGTLTLDSEHLDIGQEIVNWGFMSVSLNVNVSAMFGDAKQACCLMKIILPPETPAFLIQSDPEDPSFPKSLAPFDDEEEILIGYGAILRITRKVGLKKYTTRDGKEVELKTIYAMVVGFKEPLMAAPKTSYDELNPDPIL